MHLLAYFVYVQLGVKTSFFCIDLELEHSTQQFKVLTLKWKKSKPNSDEFFFISYITFVN